MDYTVAFLKTRHLLQPIKNYILLSIAISAGATVAVKQILKMCKDPQSTELPYFTYGF